jgi:hypothetical protein
MTYSTPEVECLVTLSSPYFFQALYLGLEIRNLSIWHRKFWICTDVNVISKAWFDSRRKIEEILGGTYCHSRKT